ncbi:D-glucuronyl C5-epimerase isoform X2 [Oratosquilla oratoria]|uniref:D-glucuronyl C5-epimerase isoform X2 n=1 Tax=Oratosquilla oratoria TaxID=337810 RepID=UPI003F772113
MRVTVRGLVLVGSVGVMATTVLLLTQCRQPPSRAPLSPRDSVVVRSDAAAAAAAVGSSGGGGGPPRLREGPQPHRTVLQTSHVHGAAGGGGVGGAGVEESYVEEEDGTRDQQTLPHQDDTVGGAGGGPGGGGQDLVVSEIPCVINQASTISCRRDDQDVYVPFDFLHHYFEVYGRVLVDEGGTEVFEWSHSYSKVYEPQGPYHPYGTFLNFQLYNVEARDRVKCISGTEGVPISTQWKSSGHTYPIQIAQFGLSHYCRHLAEPPPNRVILEDGHDHRAKWHTDDATTGTKKAWRTHDPEQNTHVLKISSPESPSSGGVTLRLASLPDLLVLSLNILLQHNASFSVALEYKDKRSEVYFLHYVRSNTLIEVKEHHIFYGLGDSIGWRRITRNLAIDLQKGGAVSKKMKKVSKSKVKVLSLTIYGDCTLDNVTLSTSEHLHHFYDAADWLLAHQDSRGGWPIAVSRKIVPGKLELDSGWYSAMAQGQAMSLLVRAGYHSGNPRYVEAAMRATHLFTKDARNGGVRTYFPGNNVWYEEYPTTPSLFVLNGFIYSLLGLYDLKESQNTANSEAAVLFEEGMTSLKKLLPLFDTGSGSMYDLRHFTIHSPPNLARWDYHTTHITQLLLLASIDADPVLASTAKRWKSYVVGKRAPHN